MAKNRNTPAPARAGTSSAAAAPLTAIFPRWLVILLGVTCFLITAAVLVMWLLNPRALYAFESDIPRFVLCLALSVFLGIFLFILYPQRTVFSSKILDIFVRLVGPPALVLFLLVVLMRFAPKPLGLTGWLFQPKDSRGAEVALRAGTVAVRSLDGGNFRIVRGPNDELVGIYVEFAPGESEHRALVQAGTAKEEEVVFNRGSQFITLKLER